MPFQDEMLILKRDATNIHVADRNAVAVYIYDLVVGHVSSTEYGIYSNSIAAR